MSTVTFLAAVLIAFGILGVIVPVIPGLLLVAVGIGLWSAQESSVAGWTVFGVSVAVLVLGTVVKYALPGRRLRESGVPWITLAFGGLLAVIGFFVVPVLGLPLGFVLGIYLAELLRLGNHPQAWSSTLAALRAVGLSMLIELAAGMIAAAVWVAGVLLT